jgi:hypothetical protein
LLCICIPSSSYLETNSRSLLGTVPHFSLVSSLEERTPSDDRLRTRRTGEVTHATLLRDPRSLTAQSFLVLVRDDEDPMSRFHRVCDGLITTPLHPTWAPWLWRWATQSGALQALQSVGCRAWQGCVDEVQLEQALSRALANELLRIPSVASSS